jgi:predicted  nucleic acid-binding Zn ribbon protein
MPWFEISLNVKKNVSRVKFKEEVIAWLVCLEKFGYIICRSYSTFWKSKTNLVIYTDAVYIDSLAIQYYNKYVLEDYQKVCKSLSAMPLFTLKEYMANKKVVNLKNAKELYLFTHLFDDGSSLKHGETGRDIPIYMLPMKLNESDDIYFWASRYGDYDSINISCHKLEIPAYKQLADIKSELSKNGKVLCKEIELATGKPTYYFLHRYWGWINKNKELNRPCPSCGKPWLNNQKTKKGLNSFDYKCISCRLISLSASSFDNEKYAEIGYEKKILK